MRRAYHVPMTNETPKPLLSETDDRYTVKGLVVINRETGKPDSYIALTRDEIDMPGYVESVERGYDGSQWRTERTSHPKWRVEGEVHRSNRLDPHGMLTDEQVEERARLGHGHVRPRLRNGTPIYAKCGGPKICPVCKHEQRLLDAGEIE